MTVKTPSLLERITEVLMDWREFWIMPVVFPLSFLARCYAYYMRGSMRVSVEEHRRRAAELAADVKEARANGATRLCTARPSKTSISTRVTGRFKRSCDGQIDVTNLDRVVELDTVKGTVVVQPYVSMGVISDIILPLGWQLPVMPEMEDLTIGGLCLGYGIESSSHRVGLFFEACVISVDFVLGDGTTIVVTADNEHKELYNNMPFSYGTFGIAVAFKLRLMKTKAFVRLTMAPVGTFDDMTKRSVAIAETAGAKAPLFFEGLMFSPTHGALIYGDPCDAPASDGVVYRPLSDWWDRWYYQFVRDETRPGGPSKIVYMPVKDYTFRYSRALFWEVELMAPFTATKWFHALFGYLLPPAVRHLKMLQTEKMFETLNKHHIVQDVLVPSRHLTETLDVTTDLFDVWPLWIVFHAAPMPGGIMRADKKDKHCMFVDVGIWGVPTCILRKTGENFDGEERMRQFEAFLRKVGGVQALYAATFQTEAEFEQMFDMTAYNRLRKTYRAEEAFPTVYDKVRIRRE